MSGGVRVVMLGLIEVQLAPSVSQDFVGSTCPCMLERRGLLSKVG